MRRCFSFIIATFLAVMGSTDKLYGDFLNSYDFNGGLADTLGNGVGLLSGGGTVSGGRYSFGANQGLQLAFALPGPDYGIEIRFQMNDDTTGYNKFLDFRLLAEDMGLYILNGQVAAYDISGTNAPALTEILLDTDFTLGIVRAGGTFEIFIDGVSQFVGNTAPNDQTIPTSNTLFFFNDDNVTNGESFAGSVDFIRIHDDASTFGAVPIPEPGSLSLLVLGLLARTTVTRRRRK